jgi:predicted lipid carrier protein YhbT
MISVSNTETLQRVTNKLPLPLVEVISQQAFRHVISQHEDVFARLGVYAKRRYAFVAVDLDLAFMVWPSARRLKVMRSGALPRTGFSAPHATVRGPIHLLLNLLEGRLDGDAAFFSRALAVSGDMEAVVAVRNALDGAGIDLPNDIASGTGPLAPLIRQGLSTARQALSRERAATWN